MKKKLYEYVVPDIEVMLVNVEHGFSLSLGGEDPDPSRPGENPFFPEEDTEW